MSLGFRDYPEALSPMRHADETGARRCGRQARIDPSRRAARRCRDNLPP